MILDYAFDGLEMRPGCQHVVEQRNFAWLLAEAKCLIHLDILPQLMRGHPTPTVETLKALSLEH